MSNVWGSREPIKQQPLLPPSCVTGRYSVARPRSRPARCGAGKNSVPSVKRRQTETRLGDSVGTQLKRDFFSLFFFFFFLSRVKEGWKLLRRRQAQVQPVLGSGGAAVGGGGGVGYEGGRGGSKLSGVVTRWQHCRKKTLFEPLLLVRNGKYFSSSHAQKLSHCIIFTFTYLLLPH